MNDALNTINDLIATEQAALDASTTDEERAEHTKCLEHFNVVKKALTAVQSKVSDPDEQDALAGIVALGAAVGILNTDEDEAIFEQSVLADEVNA